MPKGIKYTTIGVKSQIEEDCPGCVVPIGWEYSNYFEKIPIYFERNWHVITFSHWQGGARPCLLNMSDPTAFVRDQIEKEGYEIPSEWVYEKWDAKIPIFCQGFLHEMAWTNLKQGSKPSFINLVDKTGFVKDRIESEGFSVHPDWVYKDNKELIPILHGEFWHHIAWGFWGKGVRPCFKNLIDKTKFIKQAIELEGFSVDKNWQYQSNKSPIFIHHNGYTYKLSWGVWQNGHRPHFRNLENKTKFVKDRCRKLGFYLPDNFEYKHHSTIFDVVTSDNKTRRTSWWLITQDQYPGSIQRLVVARVKSVLGKGKKSKIRKTEMLGETIKAILCELGERPSTNHQLDHIVPVSFFDCGTAVKPDIDQLKKCWSPNNLRWLRKSENMKRGNRLEDFEVAHMTIDQLSILRGAARRASWGWPDKRIDAILNESKKHSIGQLKLNLLAATHTD